MSNLSEYVSNIKIGTGEEVPIYIPHNAFSKVKVGSTVINAADDLDTLELVAGPAVTLTPDANNKKVTISSSDTTYPNASANNPGLMSASDYSKLHGMSNFVAGSYLYRGDEISGSFSFHDDALIGKTKIVAVTHNVGNPILRVVMTPSHPGDVTVYFSDRVSQMQIDYIAW